MRNTFFSILLVGFAIFTLSLNSLAQDYTQFSLPEGAKARLGKGSISEIAYSPDGRHLAVASRIGIWLYDAQTGEELDLLTEHTHSVSSIAFSPDGNTIASGSRDATIRLWNANTGRHLHTLTGHTRSVESVAFSPDGNTLATGGSWDKTVRLWEADTGRHLYTLTGHKGLVASVAFSPDGNTIATGGPFDPTRLWEADTGRHLHTLTRYNSYASSVAFSPDGNTIATGGSWNQTIQLWDANTRGLLHTLTGHTDWVNSVAFAPDGKTLASGSDDKTIGLWDTNTGRLLHILTGHTQPVYSVVFSPDGLTLASVIGDGTVLLWELALTSVAPERLTADVNKDGVVNIMDLILVASNFRKTGKNTADVNSDGIVNIMDLALVAGAFGNTAAAPSIWNLDQKIAPTRDQVQQWLHQAKQMNLTDSTFQRGILTLEQLLSVLTPKETALLPNYPNPFNPETWIPYQLSEPADVSISIYSADGTLVRTLELGHRSVGIYESRSRAAYWDGRNTLSEPVASGVYFYTLTTSEFTTIRKMLIRK